MKGVILAGGKGTRMLPSTNTINKHLLPVYAKEQGAIPLIYYPLTTLTKSGITEILIVTSEEAAGLIIENLKDGEKVGADLTYKIQTMNNPDKPLGIASALKLSKTFVGNENFCVILGDNFFEESFAEDVKEFSNKNNFMAKIFLKEVPDPQRFGVASVADHKVVKLVEKPKEPESNLASTGFYFFNPNVFSVASTLKPSSRGELEIVDIHNHYISHGLLTYRTLKGYWSDAGTPDSMVRTVEWINDNHYKAEYKDK